MRRKEGQQPNLIRSLITSFREEMEKHSKVFGAFPKELSSNYDHSNLTILI